MARSDKTAPRTTAEAALIIFAKAPIPGQVKTRLCPPLTGDEAATLHGSLVLDALERTRLAGIDRYVAAAPSADHVFFKILEERHGVRLIDQQGDDLGERMRRALDAVLDRGHRKAVLVGTDLPALSGALVGQALATLTDHDLVLGPALDGGYYLIGLTRAIPELFADIPWSSDGVLAVTQERARTLALRTGLLPSHRDLDTVDDMVALAGLRSPSVSKRTEDVLRSLTDRIRTRTGAGDRAR